MWGAGRRPGPSRPSFTQGGRLDPGWAQPFPCVMDVQQRGATAQGLCARVSVSHGVSTDSSASNHGELCPLTPALLGSRVGLFLRTPQKGVVVSFEAISYPCCRLGLALSCLQVILSVFLGLHIYGYFRLAGGSLTLFGCTSLYVFTVLE